MASARIAASRIAAVLISSSIALLAAPASPSAAAASSTSSAPAARIAAVRARAASSCPNTGLTPQPSNLGLIRAAVLCLINQEREAHGESALQPNTKLARVAQGHSEDMASEDYFSHTAPNGETPLDRIRASGYIGSSQDGYEVGENIAWGTLWLASPQSIVSAWMASPGHRANILDAHYRETGIGISSHPPASLADGQTGGIYTQDFGTIIPATGRASRDAGGAGSAAGTDRSHAGDHPGRSNTGSSDAGTGADARAHHKDRRHRRHQHRRRRRRRHHKRRLRRHRKRHRHTRPS